MPCSLLSGLARQSLGRIIGLIWLVTLRAPGAAAEVPVDEDYNQWKKALGTHAATASQHLTALPGFEVDLLRSAGTNEGSWVALAFDPRGRIVIAREDRGLLRLTSSGDPSGAPRVEVINTNLLECRGLLFAYDALYVNANNSKGLYRLRDSNSDDQFDEITLLKTTPGGVGHGRNQLALGADGMIYSIHGDDVGLPAEGVSTGTPLRHYAEDRLLPCAWDKHLFNASSRMPLGHVIRTDRDGRSWELMAGGLRNPYGIAFNPAGDLFTYDADMEWDVGMSWYHPTRVLHLVPGGDYGWRRGTGVLPVWSPDTLPSAVDIGLGSPTAVQFGTKSNFPEPWRSALYILDWAYGKIHAVHLRPTGATYTGRAEVFLKGRPLNITGLDFGPDGAMYFVTGGRRTQSGLYRVRWAGPAFARGLRRGKPDAPATSIQAAPAARARKLSSLAWLDTGDVDKIWSQLGDPDPWVRHAARVSLEARAVSEWGARALQEPRPLAAFTALLALARAGAADRAQQARIYGRVHDLLEGSASPPGPELQLLALRTLAVWSVRVSKPDSEQRVRSIRWWEDRFPGPDGRVNQSLCEWLVYLGSAHVLDRTLPLLSSPVPQEEKLHYLLTLRLITNGWSLPQRRTYFEWLGRARREFQGASMLPTAINHIRAEVEATLGAEERAALADSIAALERTSGVAPVPLTTRRFVKEWTMNDFAEPWRSASGQVTARERGRRLFNEVGCAQCHRVGGEGGLAGPDLTAVGSRFDSRALLESILEPSKVIADMYRTVRITTRAGMILEGRIVAEDTASLVLATNPLDPADHRHHITKSDIVSQKSSEISSMPASLLNGLQKEEVIELMQWLIDNAQ